MHACLLTNILSRLKLKHRFFFFMKCFCISHNSMKYDLLPYGWKPVKFQDAMNETCCKKAQTKVETNLVNYCIFLK